jgi:hypothetical protein
MGAQRSPFMLKDCALITLATGVRAQTLKEFRDGLQRVPVVSIYHHLWGRLLRPQFDEPEYNNDFSSWAYRGLHDKLLAERLSMVIPTDFNNLEDVRQELLEAVEQRLDESELIFWASADEQFHFLQGQIVIFDTGRRLEDPADLLRLLPELSTGSIFYHFIDARQRTASRCDDFSAWVQTFGPPGEELAERLCGIDPYFSSLKEIRHLVQNLFQTSLGGEG